MKGTAKILLCTALLGSGLMATDIVAVKVSSDLSKLNVNSKEWKAAKFSNVELYPQTTIDNNDKVASANIKKETKKVAKVGALYNGSNIVFLVKWSDGTANIQNSTDTFGDGFALQFPKNYSDVEKLPYIGMGSDNRPVVVYLNKNAAPFVAPNGDIQKALHKDNLNLFGDDLAKRNEEVKSAMTKNYAKAFVAEGFRSTTEIKDSKFSMAMNYGKKEWNGILNKPISDEYLSIAGAIPVALAIWDGDKANRDGAKLLSGWNLLKLENSDASKVYSDNLHKVSKGNATKGKEVATAQCAACHTMGAMVAPSKYMAPNLSNIGGQATYNYIKESIVEPNAVVVPGYNRNAHSGTPWYNVEDGKRVSVMPSYKEMLQPAEIEDLIAYLQTLKTTGGKK
jgi:complex iron-sulfur molybdoenzyme family reductase subunit gamma